MKIVHWTSVHPQTDTRIFYKMCVSLSELGEEVHFVVPSTNSESSGIRVKNVVVHNIFSAPDRTRLCRMSATCYKGLRKALGLKADLYHFHDPELIPWALVLVICNYKVIYDIHEFYPEAVMEKNYLPKGLRPLVALSLKYLEYYASKLFSGIVVAHGPILDRVSNKNVAVVQNFAIIHEKSPSAASTSTQPTCPDIFYVIYVGCISRIRGVLELVRALGLLNSGLQIKLQLVGEFESEHLHAEAQATIGWERVEYLGWQSVGQVNALFREARVGIVNFHPVKYHLDSLPNKLFEYMAAGLPVIASNFPRWRPIVEDSQCGLLIDPLQPDEIANAIEWIMTHKKEAEEMGQRGRSAVISKYNWQTEFLKLKNLYNDILGS